MQEGLHNTAPSCKVGPHHKFERKCFRKICNKNCMQIAKKKLTKKMRMFFSLYIVIKHGVNV